MAEKVRYVLPINLRSYFLFFFLIFFLSSLSLETERVKVQSSLLAFCYERRKTLKTLDDRHLNILGDLPNSLFLCNFKSKVLEREAKNRLFKLSLW